MTTTSTEHETEQATEQPTEHETEQASGTQEQAGAGQPGAEHYDFGRIEPKWQAAWDAAEAFRTPREPDPKKPKYYVLDMFPYPSGDGLHVGHPEGYTATDIVARYKRMRGFNVLHPMGWDSFGLPAERYAMRTGIHPAVTTKKNVENFKRQIRRLGFSYDWTREIATSDPSYYRFTQAIFLKLYERGLAYQAELSVNFCPAQGTVLANEEVKDGRYVETGDPVEKRVMKQWMLRITAYAERLLEDLALLDWPESVKEMQRHWIGKSEGAEVTFRVDESDAKFTVFTTRPDTLFGATYCVLAPEHPLLMEVVSEGQREAVAAYVAAAKAKSDRERGDDSKEKTGVFVGAHAVNPATRQPIPIWVADYVLMGYGTGAIMAVPGHDQRDHEFATKYGLPIVEVVKGGDVTRAAYEGDGEHVNSEFLDGADIAEAKKRMVTWLGNRKIGEARVTYRLRDWLFSRQRYWGEPIPVVTLAAGTPRAVPESDLPLTLPELDEYKPTADGRPPLARRADWVATRDPVTGAPAERETNTMPQWAGSCWYYLRFIDPWNTGAPVDAGLEKYWMPVDLYVGGAEHAVLHLLYARFWHKVLYDCGMVTTKEPFHRLFNQGMVLAYSYRAKSGKYFYPHEVEQRGGKWFAKEAKGADGEALEVETQIEKMSKSRLNVVNPDQVIERYGADAMRAYEMFMGPLDRDKPWSDEGIQGVSRFLARVWRFYLAQVEAHGAGVGETAPSEALLRAHHRLIKKVGEDIEGLRFNTALAAMMETLNLAYQEYPPAQRAGEATRAMPRAMLDEFLIVLAPFCPHIAEELWARLGHETLVSLEKFATYDPALTVEDTVTIVVQVNGKKRAELQVAKDADKAAVEKMALAHPDTQRFTAGLTVRKVVVVPGKLVSVVAN